MFIQFPLRFLVCGLMLGLVASTCAASSGLPLNQIVDADGAVRIPQGFAGEIDPRGYDMYTNARGEPRFFPHVEALSSSDPPVWIGFGAARHGCNGPIYSSLRLPDGDLIFGGAFTICGGTPAAKIVRWDGTRYWALGSSQIVGTQISGVRALALVGNDVYAGGDVGWLQTAEGSPAATIARWDGNAWHRLDCATCQLDGNSVRALTVIGSDLYVGGDFTYANQGSSPRIALSHIARWDGQAWHALTGTLASGCDPNYPGVFDPVDALANDGTRVYVGGEFTLACAAPGDTKAPGVTAWHIAQWDQTTWSSLGGGDENGVNGNVAALAYATGSLYVGGNFDFAGTSLAHFVARWDGGAWHSLGTAGENGLSAPVAALTAFGGQLYVGGAFRAAGSTVALRVARWDGGSWSALGEGLGTNSNGDASTIDAIVANGHGLVAAGSITSAPGIDTANALAQWNGAAWGPLISTADLTMIDGTVNAMAARGNELFVGGAITRVGETPVHNVARWDGISWTRLGTAKANGVDGEVFALAATPDKVFVGGAFTHAGANPANHVAVWDANGWSALGDGVDADVHALAALDDVAVYAGGTFTHTGDQAMNAIGLWNGTSWQALPSPGGANGFCGYVLALAVYGQGVYVGGSFPNASCAPGSAAPGRNVAYWSGSDWVPLLEAGAILDGVNPNGSAPTQVNALAVVGNDLYVGGDFAVVYKADGPYLASNIVRWRANEWNPVNSGWPASQLRTHSLGALGKQAFAGTDRGDVMLWDESAQHWSTMAQTKIQYQDIRAFAASGAMLYVGGAFIDLTDPLAPTAASGDLATSGWAAAFQNEVFKGGFEN